ncbi:MAG: hypothetical protein ABI460_03215 [Caldimonas sp.]
MKSTWRTLWQQQDLVVYRDEVEVDRIEAARIECVYLVYRGSGDSPGDIGMTVVELDNGYAIFEAQTGFAGRVNFERHAFWHAKQCVFWVSAASASLPWRLRLGAWPAAAPSRAYRRLERSDLEGCIANWALEGPETWEDRKKGRMARSRPFGFSSQARA